MSVVIELNAISKIYNQGKANEVRALNDVSLKIEEGELCAVCGTSGAGKSTLLNIIGCLDSPDSGEYLLFGDNVEKYSDKKRAALRNKSFGYVLQNYGLIESRTLYENVKIPLVFSDTKIKAINGKVIDSLEAVGLKGLEKRRITQLSGGQAQRAAIARALVNSPRILLADEPTGALDTNTGGDIIEHFKKINELGTTVIIVTHDEKVASKCERIIYIEDGKII
ncbi:MAG: ABC transporter ATP-binding protein [Clostridiales bacterium]|nr:ABC transporter ATP-binding protein [Clostridiales bacterium]